MARFVSIVSRIEQALGMINWQEVRCILGQGLRAFIALTILAILYTVEGTVKSYQWVQPRLAGILEHPLQSVKQGPEALYCESLQYAILGQANWVQKSIVKVGAIIIMTFDIIRQIASDSSTFAVVIQHRSVTLTWGRVNYTLAAVGGSEVYLMGSKMI